MLRFCTIFLVLGKKYKLKRLCFSALHNFRLPSTSHEFPGKRKMGVAKSIKQLPNSGDLISIDYFLVPIKNQYLITIQISILCTTSKEILVNQTLKWYSILLIMYYICLYLLRDERHTIYNSSRLLQNVSFIII